MKYEKYSIKKEKLDLLSSLKLLDKNIINKKLSDYGLKNINELKDYIIERFETCLDISKADKFTQMYFIRLLEHENSEFMSAYEQDIEDLLVFVYVNGKHYSYYIPTEIKTIIKNMLKEKDIYNPTNPEYKKANERYITVRKECVDTNIETEEINEIIEKAKKDLKKEIGEEILASNDKSEKAVEEELTLEIQ